ncbi:MAG TPA: YeeE/YedE thiosulfate transporter family protein [Burkholderiales bacterium]|nr:YeeE/YedE thiosulfate transporter family protein [Burkholderiales bacterium]
MIGLAAAGMWWLLGRLAGVSSILGAAITTRNEDSGWRLAFLAGLLAAGLLAILAFPQSVQFRLEAGYGQVILAGLLVGLGTQLGSGCTSGHGVCGVSRLSLRSIIATLAFMAAGFVAVYVVRHLL